MPFGLLKAMTRLNTAHSGQNFDILKRFDVEDLPRKQLETIELGYEFGTIPPNRIYGECNHFLDASPGPGRSLGGRNLRIRDATATSGWDVIRCKPERNSRALFSTITSGWDALRYHGCGIFPQLTRQNQNVLESYVLDNKLVGWTQDSLVVRRDEAPPLRQYERAISLFGSYMNQWGHVTFDLLLRLLSVTGYPRDTIVLLQEDTPTNFLDLVRELWGFNRFEFVPVGSSVVVADLIVPLSRTFSPVGWQSSLDVDKVCWGWVCDAPAWRELKQHANSLIGKRIAKGGERLYLRRRQSNSLFVNESDVDNFLLQTGFKVLHLEDLSVAETRRALSQAGCIVSGFGSVHTNLLFAPDDTRVIIIGPEDVSPFGFSNVLSYFGMEVSLVGCRKIAPPSAEALSPYEKKQLPIVVPIQELERAVADALGSGA
jgi:hypothetical protein